MNVYCVQFDIAWEDKPANHATVQRMLEASAPRRGSLVLLPEMFSTGFSMNVAKNAEDGTRQDQRFLAEIARRHGVFVVGGITTSASGGRGKNEALAFDPSGREIARYAKLQPFSLGSEAEHFVAGDQLAQFEWAGLRVCPLICFDLRFPEHFRRATAAGAETFIVIANWPSPRIEHWLTLLRARAIENQAFVAAVNRCGSDPHETYPGRSLIVDPRGNILVDAGADERIIEAEVEAATIRSWRKEFPALADMRKGFF